MTSSNRDSRSLFNRSLDRRTALKYGAASAGALGASRFLHAGAQDASPAAIAGPQASGPADREISGDLDIQDWLYELAAKTSRVDDLIPESVEATAAISIEPAAY